MIRVIMTRSLDSKLRSRCPLSADGFEFYEGLPARGGVAASAVVEASAPLCHEYSRPRCLLDGNAILY